MYFVGEYSGGPNEQQTYSYAKTILDLMCRHPHKDGKVLIIGGGIANFTNVADTFKVSESELQIMEQRRSLIFQQIHRPTQRKHINFISILGHNESITGDEDETSRKQN